MPERLSCSFCGKKFPSWKGLTHHQRLQHPEECDETFWISEIYVSLNRISSIFKRLESLQDFLRADKMKGFMEDLENVLDKIGPEAIEKIQARNLKWTVYKVEEEGE